MNIKWVLLSALVVVLSACASTSELTDRPVQLLPNQGIAAIVLDAPNRITRIKYVAKDANGTSFEVPDTAGGPSLYLVPVNAGRYCLQHFRYWRSEFDSVQDLGCFTAIAGHITYAGTIVPSPDLSGAQTDQQFNPTEFGTMLHQQYPVIAGQYPAAAAPTPPPGSNATPQTNLISTWIENVPNHQAQAIYVQNNASWSVRIVDLRLYNCANIKQPCDTSTVNIVLGPFARKQLLIVDPTDTTMEYSYQYDFNYQTVD